MQAALKECGDRPTPAPSPPKGRTQARQEHTAKLRKANTERTADRHRLRPRRPEPDYLYQEWQRSTS